MNKSIETGTLLAIRAFYLLIAVILSFSVITACGDKTGDQQSDGNTGQVESEENQVDEDANRGGEPELNAGRAHEYTGTIDVKMVDINNDGKVYECPMDWNVLADEPGSCPKCKMDLKDYTIDEVKENLKANRYEVK